MTTPTAGAVRRADLEAILALLAESQELDVNQAYPPELVGRFTELIPAAHVVYRENDLVGRRTPRMIDAAGACEDEAGHEDLLCERQLASAALRSWRPPGPGAEERQLAVLPPPVSSPAPLSQQVFEGCGVGCREIRRK